MKIRRYKNSYKILTYYKHAYKIIPPYRVLVDGTFCQAALQNKVNLREQIPKYLDAETDIVTTRCVLHELEALGKVVNGAHVVCKQFEVDNCHHSVPIAAKDCFVYLAKKAKKENGRKYIMATQDTILRNSLRQIGGTPSLFIGWNAILFDKLSQEAMNATDPDHKEMEKLKEIKKEVLGETTKSIIKKKKKKVKGVNPLACKKKIVKSDQNPQRTGERTSTGKRRRKKKPANGSAVESSSAGQENMET